jgi:hypothetical protein
VLGCQQQSGSIQNRRIQQHGIEHWLIDRQDGLGFQRRLDRGLGLDRERVRECPPGGNAELLVQQTWLKT